MSEIQSCDVRVTGVVQGVGFRPWIHTQATQLQLCGQVRNTADGLSITVEGAPAALRAFADNLQQRPPQHAHHSLSGTGCSHENQRPSRRAR